MEEFNEGVERVTAGLEKKRRVMTTEEKQRVAYHESGHALAATWVRHPYYRTFLDTRTLVDNPLDYRRIYIESANNDELLGATDQGEIPAIVNLPHISSVEPTLSIKTIRSRLRPPPILAK